MSTESSEISYKSFFVIWVGLIALLVGGTYISKLPISKTEIILLILGISLIKTLLVTLYYMHMKFEKLSLWLVVTFPILLVGICFLLVLPGILAR